MNLMQRGPGLRAVTATAVAVLAVLVPAAALAATAGQAVPRAAGVARCGEFSTYVWLADAPNGTAGGAGYPVEFTNTGTHACWLAGYPGVQGLTDSDRPLGPAARRISAPEHRVTLKPDQTAHAELMITFAGAIEGCHGANGAALGVYPPNLRRRQVVSSFTFGACKNVSYLGILPVTAGIGVP